MRIRKITGKIHLWLGLPSGLLVFIIAITGCLYAFQEEIQDVTQSFRHVEIQDKPYLLPSQLLVIAQNQLPGKQLHSVKYNTKGKAAEAVFYHYQPTYYYTVYLNPYNGKVLKVNDNDKSFFHFILNGHYYLWLPPVIGKPVVATTTLIFTLVLISGLILWFPKNLRMLKQSIGFIWKKRTGWKRKNFDLHNVLGFYISLFALVFAFTGLIWGYQWFASTLYKGTGGQKSLLFIPPTVHKKDSIPNSKDATDLLWQKMVNDYPSSKSIEIHPPQNDSASIEIAINNESGTYWKTDYRYFNPNTLAEIPVNSIYGKFKDARFADKLIRLNYDIHVGAIGGIPGKILAFIVSLIIASLPVTGFILWWVKRK
jgi:uncharacterized iron-regulated membrane protein